MNLVTTPAPLSTPANSRPRIFQASLHTRLVPSRPMTTASVVLVGSVSVLIGPVCRGMAPNATPSAIPKPSIPQFVQQQGERNPEWSAEGDSQSHAFLRVVIADGVIADRVLVLVLVCQLADPEYCPGQPPIRLTLGVDSSQAYAVW